MKKPDRATVMHYLGMTLIIASIVILAIEYPIIVLPLIGIGFGSMIIKRR